MTNPIELIKEASRTIQTLEEKVATFERKNTAREIVIMKVASGASTFDDIHEFEDEIQRLSDSDRDLGQLKTAMAYAGPSSYGNLGLVETETKKEASYQSDGESGEPPHLKMARLALQEAIDKD